MDEEFMGVVKLFAGSYAPEGYQECDGRLIRITENQALFSIIGTTYGGDGRTTFALPKLDPMGGCRHVICVRGLYPARP